MKHHDWSGPFTVDVGIADLRDVCVCIQCEAIVSYYSLSGFNPANPLRKFYFNDVIIPSDCDESAIQEMLLK